MSSSYAGGSYGSQSAASSLGAASGVFTLKAGATIVANTLAVLGMDSKIWPVENINYAKLPNRGAAIMGGSPSSSYSAVYGKPTIVYVPTTGEIFVPSAAATGGVSFPSSGLKISKYGVDGNLIAEILTMPESAISYDPKLLLLSNGNMVCTYSDGSNLKYQVINQLLQIVKDVTIIEGIYSGQSSATVALSGGGFMITYFANGNGLACRLAVYDNSGTAVLSPSTVYTFTGSISGGGALPALHELANGKVVWLACGPTNSGVWMGILTAAGAVDLAITNVITSEAIISYGRPAFSKMANYFAVGWYTVSDNTFKIRVFSNAGVLQGNPVGTSAQVNNGPNGATGAFLGLTNDGTNFWASFYAGNSALKLNLQRITPAAVMTNFLIGAFGDGGGQGYGIEVDIIYDRGRLIVGSTSVINTSAASARFVVFNIATLTQDTTNGGAIPIVATGGGLRMIPVGDFCFLSIAQNNSNGLSWAITRYASASVIGVTQADANPDTLVKIASQGSFPTTAMKGNNPVNFDHTAAVITAIKGTMLPYAAILSGFPK